MLVSFILGVWLAWLLEVIFARWKKSLSSERLSTTAIGLIACLFVLAVGAFGYSLFCRYMGMEAHILRAVDFVTAPTHLRILIGFALGIVAYRHRTPIREFLTSLVVQAPPPAAPPVPPGTAPAGAMPLHTAPQPADTGAVRARTWLTKAGGLPILATALVALLLVYFGDELARRLQSLKYGGLEAHFVSASTENSLRLHTRMELGEARTRDTLTRGREQTLLYNAVIAPARDKLLARSHHNKEQIAAARLTANYVSTFFSEIAEPLHGLYRCVLDASPSHDADVQKHAARLAGAWRHLSEKFADGVSKNANKTALLEPLGESLKVALEELAEPPASIGKCNKGISPRNGAADYVLGALSNGHVVAFIAGLVAVGHGQEQAVEYMEKVEPTLDTDKTGRFEFFRGRATWKFAARWYPRDDEDLQVARSIAEELIVAASEVDPNAQQGIKRYYIERRVIVINNLIYFRVRDWPEGERLLPPDINKLEELGHDLRKWVSAESIAALRSRDTDADKRTLRMVGSFHDTLAMNDIAAGYTRKDLTKSRCARISSHLSDAQRIYRKLFKANPSGFRDTVRLIESHHEIYASVCPLP